MEASMASLMPATFGTSAYDHGLLRCHTLFEQTRGSLWTSEHKSGDFLSDLARLTTLQDTGKTNITQDFVLKILDKTKDIAAAASHGSGPANNSNALEAGLLKIGDEGGPPDLADMVIACTLEEVEQMIAKANPPLTLKEHMAVKARFMRLKSQ
jgi:hypothetical protein